MKKKQEWDERLLQNDRAKDTKSKSKILKPLAVTKNLMKSRVKHGSHMVRRVLWDYLCFSHVHSRWLPI